MAAIILAVVLLGVLAAIWWANTGAVMTDRAKAATVLVVTSALVAIYVAMPLVRASNRYDAAGDDASARCRAAQDLADEWASLGVTDKFADWTSRAALDCLIAQRQRDLGL